MLISLRSLQLQDAHLVRLANVALVTDLAALKHTAQAPFVMWACGAVNDTLRSLEAVLRPHEALVQIIERDALIPDPEG